MKQTCTFFQKWKLWFWTSLNLRRIFFTGCYLFEDKSHLNFRYPLFQVFYFSHIHKGKCMYMDVYPFLHFQSHCIAFLCRCAVSILITHSYTSMNIQLHIQTASKLLEVMFPLSWTPQITWYTHTKTPKEAPCCISVKTEVIIMIWVLCSFHHQYGHGKEMILLIVGSLCKLLGPLGVVWV